MLHYLQEQETPFCRFFWSWSIDENLSLSCGGIKVNLTIYVELLSTVAAQRTIIIHTRIWHCSCDYSTTSHPLHRYMSVRWFFDKSPKLTTTLESSVDVNLHVWAPNLPSVFLPVHSGTGSESWSPHQPYRRDQAGGCRQTICWAE